MNLGDRCQDALVKVGDQFLLISKAQYLLEIYEDDPREACPHGLAHMSDKDASNLALHLMVFLGD